MLSSFLVDILASGVSSSSVVIKTLHSSIGMALLILACSVTVRHRFMMTGEDGQVHFKSFFSFKSTSISSNLLK